MIIHTKDTRMFVFSLLGIMLLILAGCSGINNDKGASSSNYGGVSRSNPSESLGVSQSGLDIDSYASQNIKQASIRIRVPTNTLNDKANMAKDKIKGMGVTIDDISYYEYSDSKQYTLVLRTSPNNFDEVTNYLGSLGEVKEISTNNNDVTKQYYDLEARISNKEKELQKLNDLYEKTSNISDLLAIEQQVSRVQTDLEILKQSKTILSDQINRSTISATIYEDRPESAQFGASMEKLGSLFVTAFSFAIIVIVAVVAFLIPIAIVAGALWKAYRIVRPVSKGGPKKAGYKEIPPLS